MAVPIEVSLLLETVRADPTTADRERVRSLASGAPDWAAFVQLAERHQVAPLAHRCLKLHAQDLIARGALHALTVHSTITARRNERFADELVRLNRLLRAQGLDVISYKGPAAAVDLYGDVRLRTFGDMDFLVKRSDLDSVCDLLRENGYRNVWTGTPEQKELFEQEQKEYSFISGPFMVEPHWSITARRFPFDIDYPALWQRGREIELNGSTLLTFGHEDMLLVLCVCGSKGKWERIQMVADVAQALRRWPDLDWRSCFDRAETSGSVRMLLLGLQLAHTLLAAPLPDHVVERIAKDRRISALAAKVARSFAVEKRDNAWTRQDVAIFSPMLFSLRDGPRDKLRYLLRTTTTPRHIHQERFRLAKSMSWAYRILVPFHDYVFTPAWFLLRQRVGARSREES